MKRKKNIIRRIVAIVAIVVSFSSCDNSYSPYIPPYKPSAKINIENGSRHKYYVEISGPENSSFTIEGKTFQEVTLTPGEYSIKSTQLEGYIFSPRKHRISVTLNDGDHKALDID